jgi:hypothetical protein
VKFQTTLARNEVEIEKQNQRARLKALKSQDETEYLRLVKEAKNERILHLLRETESFMKQMGASYNIYY